MISGLIKIMKTNYIKIAKDVIDLEIKALKKLRNNIDNSFNTAVEMISKCKSKVIFSGVGKSGIIANKIAATMSSVGTPSFYLSASDSSRGDLGSISKKDILVLISYSGKTNELKNIIQFANRNKIILISIVSRKESLLFKASDIGLLIPNVAEAAGIVPTSSTTSQLALGDALAISVMKKKGFGKKDFKKVHPAGNLGMQLKSVEDVMLKNNKIPFINENLTLHEGLKLINSKNLGLLIAVNNKKYTTGIFTDGDIKRAINNKVDLKRNLIKEFMTKKPISVEKDMLAAKALNLMNEKKITSLCVFKKGNIKKTIGIIHIHNILSANIN